MVGDGTGVFIVELVGFMFDGGIVLAGFIFDIFVELAGVIGAGVETGAVLTGVTTVVLDTFAGLTVTLVFAESPQAIPSALNPRTVESTITFFILFKDSYLSQSINFLFPGVRLIKHSRFALSSFLFKANVNIVTAEVIVN